MKWVTFEFYIISSSLWIITKSSQTPFKSNFKFKLNFRWFMPSSHNKCHKTLASAAHKSTEMKMHFLGTLWHLFLHFLCYYFHPFISYFSLPLFNVNVKCASWKYWERCKSSHEHLWNFLARRRRRRRLSRVNRSFYLLNLSQTFYNCAMTQ